MLNYRSNNKLFICEKKHMLSMTLVTAMLLLASAAYAESLDSLQLLKISPQDERAVVKMEDGSMKIIKPGDEQGGQ